MAADPTVTSTALIVRAGAADAELRDVAANDPETLRRLVGGWLEALDLASDATMYFNEDGKMHRLAANETATRLALAAGARFLPGDLIVGDAVVVGLAAGEEGGLVSADVPSSVLDLCASAGIEVVRPEG